MPAKTTTLEDFYRDINLSVPFELGKDIGHFNVFDIAEVHRSIKGKSVMPYNRRAYYKISLIKGKNRVEYADKVIQIKKAALLFATPRIPYYYQSIDSNQGGQFCVFTSDFMARSKSGMVIDNLPLFSSGGIPVMEVDKSESKEAEQIFLKMHNEINSDYAFKYDLLRNYVIELIHLGQKLQPSASLIPGHTGSKRIVSLFLELLERQFPIESPAQQLQLKSAKDYAERLSVHVNYLNSVIKETTGNTTSFILAGRITQEAIYLLKQTNWNISEIAYSLGFEEVAHFSNFFRKQTSQSPNTFRSQL